MKKAIERVRPECDELKGHPISIGDFVAIDDDDYYEKACIVMDMDENQICRIVYIGLSLTGDNVEIRKMNAHVSCLVYLAKESITENGYLWNLRDAMIKLGKIKLTKNKRN